MREMMKMSVVCVMAILVCFGCTKKAKVNLDGLDQNPAGAVQDGDNTSSNRTGNEFGAGFDGPGPLVVPVSNPDGSGPFGPNGGGNGGSNGIGGNDNWTDVSAGLAGSDAENFVKNGQYFAQKVYFDFNRSEVRPSERPKLEALANHLQQNPTFGVVIEGHCDDRGSDEYNRSLSERRSLSVKDYLVSLGIAADRMRTVSYGEDRPDVPNARTEQEHQLNRRAQFLVGAIR